MNNNIKENFINITIPQVPDNIRDVPVNICEQTANILNRSIIPPLNRSISDIINIINTASTNIRRGIIEAMKGIDTAVSASTNGINVSIDAINQSSKTINKVVTFFGSIINVNTFFDFMKTIITFMLLTVIPSSEIPNVSLYASLTIYLIIFIFILSPIITLMFVFL